MLSLAKAHAYGNDFLFIPHEHAEGIDPHALARATCARHTGVGADGLILYSMAPDGAARMTLYNADGSHAELSGNGLRCLAALVLHQRPQQPDGGEPLGEVRVETDAGWKSLAFVARTRNRYTFRAAMGHPADIRHETLNVEGEPVDVTTLRMGNPQCVTLVPHLPDQARFAQLGSALSLHPQFAAGTNVEFAKIEAPNRVRILIWERGVGPTQASGTGACAAAVAAVVRGGADRDLDVISPGGTQRVEWRDDGVYLTGWAEIVFDGHWIADADAAPGARGR
jgi:diaminopimelate epimerase